MMIAEVALDRYLKSYEPPLTIRERYPAKQDLGRLEPEALGWILGMVQYAVNGRYAGLGQAIRTPYGQVNVHLDFTETPKVERHVAENAVSFVRDGYAFLILSIPIVRRMFTICEEVGLTPAIWELLGLAPTDVKDKANLIAMLAVVQLQFVSNHELGHHFHGHCHTQDEVSSPVQEFDDGAPAGDEHPLRQQAMEVDADSYAVQLQVDQLLSGPMGDRAFAKLAPKGISKDVFLLNFLFVSIASYMFLKPQASIDPAVIKLRKHPPELMRMNVIMRVIKAWLSEHRTDLLSWTEDGQFKKMMSAVEACYSESDAPLFWRQQGEFLESAEGARYWDELIAEKDKLWGEMEAFRWQLVEVGDQADEACSPPEA